MFGDTAYKDYLNPEQQKDSETMGWLNAANVLANMSAPRQGTSIQATPLQLLTGGLGGYVGGQQDYVKQLSSYYKPLQDMKRNNEMNTYMSSPQGQEYTQTLGLPQGMPVSPDTVSGIAQKRAEKTGDLQLEQFYKPTTEGLIEQAKNPALVQRAGAEEAAKNPYLVQRAGGEAAARLPAEKNMADYNANLDVWKSMNTPKEIQPQGTLVVPAQAGSGGTGGEIYKNTQPDATTRKAVAENVSNNQASNEAIKMLDTMQNLNPNTYDGYGAGTRADIAANTVGSKAKVQNTASFDALSKKFTLDLLGGKLGVAISDADRKFIEQMAPQVNETIDQRQAKIDTLRSFMQDKIKNASNVNDQLLSGSAFKPKSSSGWSIEKAQ